MTTGLFFGGTALFLLAALIASVGFIRPSAAGRRAGLGLLMAGGSLTATSALLALTSNSQLELRLLDITQSLSLSFYLDRLSAFFILIISLIAACVAVYSLKYMEHGSNATRKHWGVVMMGLFVLSMVLTVASANFFSFIFFWELMSLSSLFLVLYEREQPETRKAGMYYLVMTQFSTLFILLGALLLNHFTGSLNIQSAGSLATADASLVFGAFFVGLATKAGVIPFHKWLPFAHAAAPSNISALMSGVMIKVAIYGLARLIIDVLSPQLSWGIVLLVFGSISAVLGVIYALKEHDLKKLLAYHSIENIGIIIIGLGLYVIFGHYGLTALADLSLAGALFHTLNHAIFKSLLFMTAGSVVVATGTRNIEEMGGLVKRMPATAVIFLLGAAAISALPPLNGFASEMMLFQSFFGAFELPDPFISILLFVALAAFALMSALAAACFVKAFGIVFLALPRSKRATDAVESPRAMLIAPAILAVLCIVLGVFSYQILRALGLNLPMPNLLPVSIITLSVFGLAVAMVRRARAPVRLSETWGCGIPSQTSSMEYTASGFSEPIITIFSPIFRTRKDFKREFSDKTEILVKGGHAEIRTLQFFEERIYMPTGRFVQRLAGYISRFQNADLDALILFAFIGVVLILVAAGWLL